MLRPVALVLTSGLCLAAGSTAVGGAAARADVPGYHESSGAVHGSYRAPDGTVTEAPPDLLGNLLDGIRTDFDQAVICDELRGQVEERGGHTAGWPCIVGEPRLFLAKQSDGLHFQVQVPVTHLEFTYTVPDLPIPDPDIVASFTVTADATVTSDDHTDGSPGAAPLRLTKVETTVGGAHLTTDDVLVPDSMLRDKEAEFNATHRIETPDQQLEHGSFARVQPSIDSSNQKLRDGANTIAALLRPAFPTTNTFFELQTDVDPGTGAADAALVVTFSRAFDPPNPAACTPTVVWPGSSVLSTCTDTWSTAELRGTVDARGDVHLDGDDVVGRGIPIRMAWQNNTENPVAGSFYAVLANRYGSGSSPVLDATLTAGVAGSPGGAGGGDPYGVGQPAPCYSGYHPVPCRHLID